MPNKPAVSVIIPTYNQADFLREALDSLIKQTVSDWEAVIINNFSTDHTVDVINGFHDPRIRLENFKNNGCIAASRNLGIKMAHSDLIAFLDSDDLWYPKKLEKCLQLLEGNVDLVCHGLRHTRNGKPVRDVILGPVEKSKYKNLLFGRNCLTPSAVVVRKECLLQVGCFSENIDFITAEDYDLWLKLSKQGYMFQFFDDILGEYRWHDGNASKSITRQMKATRRVVDSHFERFEKATFQDKMRLNKKRVFILLSTIKNLGLNQVRGFFK